MLDCDWSSDVCSSDLGALAFPHHVGWTGADAEAHDPAVQSCWEIEARAKAATARLDELKTRLKQTESERKQLEVEAAAKRTQADKYRGQQLQTKKNEEYQALAHEIEGCEKAVHEVEDRELDLMEQAEKVAVEIKAEQQILNDINAQAERQRDAIAKREAASKADIEKLKAERAELAGGVDETFLSRYERIMRHRRDAAIVPVQHGNCGGCHLQLPPQTVHQAKGGEGLVTCDECGRILYWIAEYEHATPAAAG
jgi:predicted  nucleic acid-binding Zn-ribbon protein